MAPGRRAGAARCFRPPPDVAARAAQPTGASLSERGAGLLAAAVPLPSSPSSSPPPPPPAALPLPARPPGLTGEFGAAPPPPLCLGGARTLRHLPTRRDPRGRQRFPEGCGRAGSRAGPGAVTCVLLPTRSREVTCAAIPKRGSYPVIICVTAKLQAVGSSGPAAIEDGDACLGGCELCGCTAVCARTGQAWRLGNARTESCSVRRWSGNGRRGQRAELGCWQNWAAGRTGLGQREAAWNWAAYGSPPSRFVCSISFSLPKLSIVEMNVGGE